VPSDGAPRRLSGFTAARRSVSGVLRLAVGARPGRGVIPGFQRSARMRKRGAAVRAPVAALFLLLELPILLPVIAGAGLMALVMGVRGVARRLSPGGR